MCVCVCVCVSVSVILFLSLLFFLCVHLRNIFPMKFTFNALSQSSTYSVSSCVPSINVGMLIISLYVQNKHPLCRHTMVQGFIQGFKSYIHKQCFMSKVHFPKKKDDKIQKKSFLQTRCCVVVSSDVYFVDKLHPVLRR